MVYKLESHGFQSSNEPFTTVRVEVSAIGAPVLPWARRNDSTVVSRSALGLDLGLGFTIQQFEIHLLSAFYPTCDRL